LPQKRVFRLTSYKDTYTLQIDINVDLSSVGAYYGNRLGFTFFAFTGDGISIAFLSGPTASEMGNPRKVKGVNLAGILGGASLVCVPDEVGIPAVIVSLNLKAVMAVIVVPYLSPINCVLDHGG
jgi:hypothetical protein